MPENITRWSIALSLPLTFAAEAAVDKQRRSDMAGSSSITRSRHRERARRYNGCVAQDHQGTKQADLMQLVLAFCPITHRRRPAQDGALWQ